MEQIRGESLGQYAPNPVVPFSNGGEVSYFDNGGEVSYFDNVSGYAQDDPIDNRTAHQRFMQIYAPYSPINPNPGGLAGHALKANPNMFGDVNNTPSFSRTATTGTADNTAADNTAADNTAADNTAASNNNTVASNTAASNNNTVASNTAADNTATNVAYNPLVAPGALDTPIFTAGQTTPTNNTNTRTSTTVQSQLRSANPFGPNSPILRTLYNQVGMGNQNLALGAGYQPRHGQDIPHTPASYQAAVAAGNQAGYIGNRSAADRQAEYFAATGGGNNSGVNFAVATPPGGGLAPPPITGAGGGIVSLQGGGLTAGVGDGMSDQIMTTIEGKQPAALSAGEFVIPADVVSGIGNGDTNSGAKRLYAMMDNIRGARTGKMTQPQRIAPRLPA